MATFNLPTRETVNTQNQAIFDQLEKSVGFVPNLFATYAHSETALGNYLTFSNAKTSLRTKEKEVINLAVSQVNNCEYCLAAHTAIGKMNGFTDDQILELRQGYASFDAKLNALASFAREVTLNRGQVSTEVTDRFLAAGWTKANLIDTLLLIGDKTISNLINNVTQIPVDFPAAPQLEEALV
ncbi:MAG: carboxymuconolactone decarboxylase family protein [Bacteroidota bacterium]